MSYKDNAWGLMLTSYEASVNREAAKEADFFLVRMGGTEDVQRDIYTDAKFNDWVQLAYDINRPVIAFWNVAPRFWLKWTGPCAQFTQKAVADLPDDKHPILQEILKNLRNGSAWKNGTSVHAFYFDVEDYSFWTNGGPVTDSWITFYINDIWERMARMIMKGNMPPIAFGSYSRKLFIDEKCPSLNTFLGNRPEFQIMPAEWISGPDGIGPLSKIKQIRPADSHVPRLFGMNPRKWTVWQYLGDLKAESPASTWKSTDVVNALGNPRPICAQIFNGTVAEMHKELKFKPRDVVVPPPPPPPPPDNQEPTGDLAALTARVAAIEAKLASVKGAL